VFAASSEPLAVLVARRVFGPGDATAHRVQGAVLLYLNVATLFLNVATLFAIAYDMLQMHWAGAIRPGGGGLLPQYQRGPQSSGISAWPRSQPRAMAP
jgi:hypothetical protein